MTEPTLSELLVDEVLAYTDDDLAVMTDAELAEYDREVDAAAAMWAREHESDWDGWLRLMFPSHFAAGFGPHHAEFWQWVWTIELGVRPDNAFVGVWPRGGAKSTSAEAATAALGARRQRQFVLYVCETQHQADDHVGNIGALLESNMVDMAYPELGRRKSRKYTQGGWRRNRLETEAGLIVDAVGLDTAARGIKLEEFRPDLIVIDDIDNPNDGPGQVDRKTHALTDTLLPAGDSKSLAVLVIQNIPNPDGIVAKIAGIAETEADYLRPRIVCGPIPAIEDLTVEPRSNGEGHVIVSGRPTWEGQPLDACQEQIDLYGLTAFLAEAQHETDARDVGVFKDVVFVHCKFEDVPWDTIGQVAVACDPAVTNTDESDSQAVQVDGLAADGTVYRLRSWEQRADPVTAIKVAVVFAIRFGTRKVIIETDQGGDTWNSVYREAVEEVRADIAALSAGEPVDGPDIYASTLLEVVADDLVFPLLHQPAQEKAGSSQLSKAARAQQMLGQYESKRRIVHVLGTHLVLERSLRRFGKRKPFDLTDAAYYSLRDLLRFGQKSKTSARRAAATTLPALQLGSAPR